MPFHILCRGCRSRLRVPESLLGKTIKCPKCARKMMLRKPSPPASPKKSPATMAPVRKMPPAGSGVPRTAKHKLAESKKTTLAPTSAAPRAQAPPTPKKTSPPVKPPAAATRLNSPGRSTKRASGTWTLLACSVLLLLVAAVGWFYFSASDLAFISGKITMEGTALSHAKLIVVGDSGSPGPFVTRTDEQGKYTLLSNTNTGIPPGNYRVMVSKKALDDGTMPRGPELEDAIRRGKLRDFVPRPYDAYATTPLRAEIKAGSHTVDFELKKEL